MDDEVESPSYKGADAETPPAKPAPPAASAAAAEPEAPPAPPVFDDTPTQGITVAVSRSTPAQPTGRRIPQLREEDERFGARPKEEEEEEEQALSPPFSRLNRPPFTPPPTHLSSSSVQSFFPFLSFA